MRPTASAFAHNTLVRGLGDSRALWRLWVAPLCVIGLGVPLSIVLVLIQRELVDSVMLAGRLDLLASTLGLFALIWLISTGLEIVGGPVRTYLDERLTMHLRLRLFDHCERLSVGLWHREHSGRTMALFSNDVPVVAGFLGTGLVISFGQVVALVLGGIVMWHLSWQLALVVISVPPLIAVLATVLTRPLRNVARKVRDKAAELSEHLHESLGGLREIAAFGQEVAQRRRLGATLRELLQLRMRLAVIGSFIGAGQNGFSIAVTLILFGVGGYLVIVGETTLGTLIAMQNLFGQVYLPAKALVGTALGVQQTLAAADRVYEFLDLEPRVREHPRARDPGGIRGEVVFQEVEFAYAADRPALRDVSFSALPGESIAIVGPSGAGKSTLVGLIARFYDPDRGRVLLDGADLRDLTLAGLRRQLALVPQDPFLFATTIRDNIAFGREGATEDEIVAAARAACAWEFIEQLPACLDTQVGQRAVQLSEGQKQRLAIARALLRDPRVLILDEPTSSLDARSERFLQGALQNVMHNRTTFVIAHRLSTIRLTDRILVLDGGRIVEQGSPSELLEQRGLYHELYELQFGGANGAAPDESLALV